jgi:hypothetical protein
MMGLIKPGAAIVAAVAAGTAMGGWAVVTVKDLPDYFVAGQQYRIEFQVRQHGMNLLGGLEPRLIVSTKEPGWLRGAAERGAIAATAAGEGTYAATFTAPAADQVFLVIKNGFGGELRLYPQPVVAAGARGPATTPVDRGQVLFVAKGCNTCHANTNLRDRPDNRTFGDAPALGGRRFDQQYLVAKITRPGSERMPDLGLREAEVQALAAFLNGSGNGGVAGGSGSR